MRSFSSFCGGFCAGFRADFRAGFRGKKRAFTVLELVVVIVILGILAAIAGPRLMKARHNANAVQIISHLRQALDDADKLRDLSQQAPAVLTSAKQAASFTETAGTVGAWALCGGDLCAQNLKCFSVQFAPATGAIVAKSVAEKSKKDNRYCADAAQLAASEGLLN